MRIFREVFNQCEAVLQRIAEEYERIIENARFDSEDETAIQSGHDFAKQVVSRLK